MKASREWPACPVEVTLSLIGNRWKILIIRDLLNNGTMRFGELKKSLGLVTQKVLTSNLRELEEKGVLTRRIYAQVPPRVEYTLTSIGESLRPVLDSLATWGHWYRSEQGQVETPAGAIQDSA